MTYVYRCTQCGDRLETPRYLEMPATHDNPDKFCFAGDVVRDYRAENVGVDRSSLK